MRLLEVMKTNRGLRDTQEQVWINPLEINYVKRKGKGTVVVFSAHLEVEIEESVEQVLARIANGLSET